MRCSIAPAFRPSCISPGVMADDTELLRRFSEGDESAFDSIVKLYHERVFQFVYRVLSDFDDAADIAQETFIRAYDKLGQFKGRAGIYTWLYRIALNLSINCLRKRKLRTMVGLDEAPPAALKSSLGGPESDLDDSTTRGRIERAVAELPTRQRSIFILRQYDGLSHGEIASVVGTSEGAVRAGYFHAIRKLRNSLADLVEMDNSTEEVGFRADEM